MRLIWLVLFFSQALALPFQSTWFVSNDTNITLPLNLPNTITVDWGDGTVENFTITPVSHLYGAAGEKNISVTGPIRGFSFNTLEEGLKIRNIMAWGEMVFDASSYATFWHCLDLQITATDQPIFEPGASLHGMFDGCTNFNSPLNWDVSNVTDMTEMFSNCQNLNQPIIFSNTHNVLLTHRMFFGATLFNQPVNFDTRSVTDMKGMFRGAAAFNQRLDFDTGNVLFMHEMFYGASNFNQPLNFTSTAKVSLMNYMFYAATNFNQLLDFDTSSVADMSDMFGLAINFNQSLSFFNTSSVTNMATMFANTFYDKDLSMWATDNVTSCSSFCDHCLLPAFPACLPCQSPRSNTTDGKSICICPPGSDLFTSPTQCALCLGPNYVNTGGVCECAFFGNVTFVDNAAVGCYGEFRSTWAIPSASFSLTLPLTIANDVTIDWGDGTLPENYTTIPISHVYNLTGNYTISFRGLVRGFTFKNAALIAELITDVSSWGGFTLDSGVDYVFVNCANIQVSATDQPIFLPGATLLGMFKNSNYFNSPLTWNIANVVSLAEMFFFAVSFNQPIHFSNADSVISMNDMFNSAQSFNKPLDFDTGNVYNMNSMFGGAIAFNQPLNFNTQKVEDMRFMLSSASAFNQRLDFDTRSVTNMLGMLMSAVSFNSPINFSSTANVTHMGFMFNSAGKFNQPLDFDTSAVVDMESMFTLTRKFNQMLNFNTSSVLNMDNMFLGSAMEQELTQWATTQVLACNNFCDYCGLPQFGGCTPCAAAFVNSSRGTTTCNCSVDELTNNTQCVPICPGPSYSYDGTAQNCSCVFGGVVNFVDGIAQGCNPAPPCLLPAYEGSPGSCHCAPGFSGNVTYTGNIVSGCRGFASVWYIPSDSFQLTLPLKNPINITVDWGDQSVSSFSTLPVSHIYCCPGQYTVIIGEIVTGFSFYEDLGASPTGLVDISSWGGFTIGAYEYIFANCVNLEGITATDQPIFEPGASLRGMFSGCSRFNSALTWDITNVVNLAEMFSSASILNSLITLLNTHNVVDLTGMFAGAENFDQPLVLNTINVKQMELMFSEASVFNQLLNFDTRNVQSMNDMFSGAAYFNQPLNFDTVSVLYMSNMFYNATSFNRALFFDTRSVTDMNQMFAGAVAFNQAISFGSTANVLTTARMFLNAQAFNQPVGFDTSSVLDMTSMFEGAYSFNQLVNFATNQVHNMNGMFKGASAFHQNLNAWNTDLVTDCLDFCPYCGVPSFPNCVVGCGLKTGAPGWNVCNCSSAETPVGNASCALNCVREYIGPAGNCSCAPGFNGTVTYGTGYSPQGCINATQNPANGNDTVVRVPFVNTPLAIEATRGVQVFVEPDPALGVSGTVSVSTTEPTSATVSSIVSIVFYDEAGVEKKVGNLTNRIRFVIPLRPGAADPIAVCRGDQPGEMVPLCNWFDPVSQAWSTSGCETNLSATYVECSCTHLTDFAAVLPNYNRLAIHNLIYLDGASLASNPWGLITIICVLLLFAIVLFFSLRREAKEKIQESQREAKYAKWGRRLKRTPRFWKRYRTELQMKHTWGALLWPKTGASFRTVDRAFVTLLVLFILLAMSSMFHGRDQTYFGRGEVIVSSTLAALLPSLFFAGLFSRTGKMGIKEQWEHEHHVTEASRFRCFRYRFPEWVRWMWRGMIVLCAVVLTWYILSVALMFDQNPAYYCLGETTRSWVVDFVAQYILTVLLIEPFKVLLIATAKSLSATNTSGDTNPDSDGSYSELELGDQKPSALPELPTISFAEIETTKPLGRGAFGKVDQCIWRGADCAIKRLLNPAAEQEYLHEVAMNRHLSPFKHQGVVSFLGVTQNPPGILLELYPLRSVEDFIITEGNLQSPDDLPKILTVLISASAGVVHLHMNRVIHRDIAARNFLIKKDLSTAVCDLGLALLLETGVEVGHRTEDERKTDMLPINTTAPETLARGDYSPKSDVYMFGIFMWELFARRAPHIDDPDVSGTSRNLASFATRIRAGLQLKIPPSWPEPLRVLMLACWALDPASRPSMITVNRALRDFRDLAEQQQLSLPPPLSQARVESGGEANHYHQFVPGDSYNSYVTVSEPGHNYTDNYQPCGGENKAAQTGAVGAVSNASPPASAAPAQQNQPAASLMSDPHQQGLQVAYSGYQPLPNQ